MLQLKDIHWELPSGEELIHGISFSIEPGKLTVVTGPNGGGKTSIAKLIAGLNVPSKGQIILNGQDITNTSITERAKLGISYAFQQPVKFKGLTVMQLINIAAGRELPKDKLCSLLGKVGLCANEYINRPMDSHLSGGEIKRIEIATVLARESSVLVFDEPEAGIDLWSFTSLIDTFKTLKDEQSGALLVISHQERILEIADTIIVLAGGNVRLEGSSAEIMPKLMTNEYIKSCRQFGSKEVK